MFWHFDKSGVFEMLDDCGFDLSRVGPRQDATSGALDSLRKQLDETDLQTQSLNSIQALDIVVTRHWMRVILWRLAASHGFFSRNTEAGALADNSPVAIAKDLLEAVTKADKSVIEAHGPVLVCMLPAVVVSVLTWHRKPRSSKLRAQLLMLVPSQPQKPLHQRLLMSANKLSVYWPSYTVHC